MFAARGIAVSLSVFVLIYCVLSVAISFAWRAIRLHVQRYPARRVADFLFALRVLPLACATIITVVFTVPSFLLLEPRSIDEPLGEVPLALGVCGLALGMFGILNAAAAIRRASRAISTWMLGAQPLEAVAPVPVLRISRPAPPMTAAGIVRPRVLLSGAAEFILTNNELRTALNHEVAHVSRRDNLKKLMLRFVSFPGMTGLEGAWLESTEMAADDAAVSSADEALDLAAALIKLSRLAPVGPQVDLTAALVYSPTTAMNARVERLIAWSDKQRSDKQRCEQGNDSQTSDQPGGNGRISRPAYSSWCVAAAILATFAVALVTYTQLLTQVHTATEWLVR
jgi:Zn-dependent protease with chaperone function